MQEFRNIFVAIDFSPGSDEALRQAHERVTNTGARLAVCHIVPNELRNNLFFPHISRIAALKLPLAMKQIGDAVLARVMEITGRQPAEFDLIIDDGKPQAMILDHAEKWLADLIIIGSHGQTRPADAFLGGVTESIVRHAHCPVLVSRPGRHTRQVIAGTDFSDPALPAIKAAADEATRIRGSLMVVHSLDLVWSPAAYPALAFGGAPFNISSKDIAELEASATERIQESLKQLGIQGDALVTTGAAGAELVAIAEERNAELVVVGTIGRTGLRRALLGSVAETVVRQAACSVLIVRRHPG
jgi:nucleotide-binding universal stress UspA family protein